MAICRKAARLDCTPSKTLTPTYKESWQAAWPLVPFPPALPRVWTLYEQIRKMEKMVEELGGKDSDASADPYDRPGLQ